MLHPLPSFSPPPSSPVCLIVSPAAPLTINLPASQPRGLAPAVDCSPCFCFILFQFFSILPFTSSSGFLLVRGSVCNMSYE